MIANTYWRAILSITKENESCSFSFEACFVLILSTLLPLQTRNYSSARHATEGVDSNKGARLMVGGGSKDKWPILS